MSQHFRWHKTPTVAGGTWSGVPTEDLSVTYKVRPCMMSQCLVRAATVTTEFDVDVVDDKGFIIRNATTATGVFNDLTPTPIVGDITITIKNSTVDEAFQVLIVLTTE